MSNTFPHLKRVLGSIDQQNFCWLLKILIAKMKMKHYS